MDGILGSYYVDDAKITLKDGEKIKVFNVKIRVRASKYGGIDLVGSFATMSPIGDNIPVSLKGINTVRKSPNKIHYFDDVIREFRFRETKTMAMAPIENGEYIDNINTSEVYRYTFKSGGNNG